jgi:hypothetical protein
MPTLAGHKPSSNNARGSNKRLSNIGACNTARSPPNINSTDEANAPLIYAAISAKCSDDGQEQKAAFIIYRVNEALASLESAERDAVRVRFPLKPKNHSSAAQSVDEKIFKTAMRKLMHPTRSRELRALEDLSLGKRRQV